MSKQPEFTWDETSGICECSIFLDDYMYGFGLAQCAEKDRDMISERTGSHIAEMRAKINLLQCYKNNELRPSLKALEHLKSTMIQSKKHNPESYERKRLNIEIKNIKKDIIDVEELITKLKEDLYSYINKKEQLYQRIRSHDHVGYSDNDSTTLQKDIDLYNKVIKADAN